MKRLVLAALLLLFCSTAQAAEVVDRLVAIVNDDVILLSELNASASPFIARATANVQNAAARAQAVAQVRKQVLESMISDHLVNQEARALGIIVGDREVEAALQEVKTRNGLSDEQLAQQLARQGMTLERLKEDLRAQRRRTKIVEFKVKPRVSVSEEEIRSYYRDNFKTDDEVEISLITWRIPPAATDAEKGDLKRKAEETRKAILDGASFGETAQKESEGPNAAGGGKLGRFRRGEMNAEFEAVAFRLGEGELSDVIEAGGGMHLIRVDGRDARPSKSFDEVRTRIYNIIFQRAAEKEYLAWVEELREKGFVDVRLERPLAATP